MRVSRSDVYVRSERGGDWVEDFLNDFANNKQANNENVASEIMRAIHDKEAKTVESVVQSYREMVGLDTLLDDQPQDALVSTASVKRARALSKRAGEEKEDEPVEVVEGEEPVMLIIQRHPNVERDVESLCRHSGGNKSVHAIINYLRNILGNELISYTDDSLLGYVQEVKDKYKREDGSAAEDSDVGLVGTESLDYHDDDTADYITHGDNQ